MDTEVFIFKGQIDLTQKGETGDIGINDGEIYAWFDGWKEIGNGEGNQSEEHITQCKNCGAPIDPYKRKCEYCGSYV